MKCEYCDSEIQKVPDNGICPNCGGVLPEDQQKQPVQKLKLAFPKPPIGMYKAGDEYMQLGEYGMRINKRYLVNEYKSDRVIPYCEIAEVFFSEGRTLNPGFLCVRTQADKFKPFPVTRQDAMGDSGTILVHKCNNEKYYEIYLFLKKCAEIVNSQNQE